MLKSSRNSSLRIKWASCFEHRPQHAYPSSGQRDQGLCVMFPLTPFSIVEGFGNRVSCRTSAKGALEEDALEVLVAAKGSSPCPAVTGLSDNGRQTGRRRHRIRRSEARDIACRGDETGRQDGPHAWQATDEGRIRVEVEQGLQFFVQPGQPRLDGKGLPGKLPSHSRFSWNNRMLGFGGIERDFHQSRAVGQARASLNVGEKPPGSGTTYLCWRDEACQKMQRSHCCKVERPFQAGVNAADKTAQTRDAPGLFLDKIAAASDQYPDSNGGLIIMLYAPPRARCDVRATPGCLVPTGAPGVDPSEFVGRVAVQLDQRLGRRVVPVVGGQLAGSRGLRRAGRRRAGNGRGRTPTPGSARRSASRNSRSAPAQSPRTSCRNRP